MSPEELDGKILHALMDARFNETYYRLRAQRAGSWDLLTRCAIAVVTSGAVVAWAAEFQGSLAHAWQALSLIGAVLATVGPILQLPEKARQWSDLGARWTDLSKDLRLLDAGEVPPQTREAALLRLLGASEGLQRADLEIPGDKLAKKIQGVVNEQFSDRVDLKAS